MNDDSQWNNNRNQNKGSNYAGRKHSGPKYTDNKGDNYSPSASYNYTKNGRGQGQNYQQHPRRRIDRYKRESIGSADKLVKQNDIIIKLLKEIRDNLGGSQKISGDSEQVKVENQSKASELSESESSKGESKPQETETDKGPNSKILESEGVPDKKPVPENVENISADSDQESL